MFGRPFIMIGVVEPAAAVHEVLQLLADVGDAFGSLLTDVEVVLKKRINNRIIAGVGRMILDNFINVRFDVWQRKPRNPQECF